MIIRDITDVDCPTTLNCGDIITSTKWNNLQDTLNLAHKQGRTVVSESGHTDTDTIDAFFPIIGIRSFGISTLSFTIDLPFAFSMPPGYRRGLLLFDVALVFGFGSGQGATGIWEDIQFDIVGLGGEATIARIFPEGSPFISPGGIIVTGGFDHRAPFTGFAEIEIPRFLLPNANTTNELYLRVTRRTQSLQDSPTFFQFSNVNWAGIGYVTFKIFKGFDR